MTTPAVGGRSLQVPGLGHGSTPIPVAARVGPVLVTGGVSGMDPSTGTVPEDLGQQVAQLFRNLAAVLEAGGASSRNVAKITFFVRDRAHRSAINREWTAMFPEEGDRPARHTLVYEHLPQGVDVQAELLAFVGDEHPAGRRGEQ